MALLREFEGPELWSHFRGYAPNAGGPDISSVLVIARCTLDISWLVRLCQVLDSCAVGGLLLSQGHSDSE